MAWSSKKKVLTPEAARIRAEELCARAEHSAGEILDKLYRWGIAPDAAAAIVEALRRTRFIDDTRFARAYCRDKLEYSRWGRRKIALGLYQKRVAREVINEALDEIDPERYREVLRAVMTAKRNSTEDADTYEGRTKIFRHAVSRGFEPDIVVSLMREL